MLWEGLPVKCHKKFVLSCDESHFNLYFYFLFYVILNSNTTTTFSQHYLSVKLLLVYIESPLTPFYCLPFIVCYLSNVVKTL